MNDDRATAQLAAIVNSSDDAIISKSVDGVIESWNAGAERLYGYTAEEVVGKNMSTLLPKSLIAQEQEILSKVRAGEHVQHFETVRIHSSGRPVAVSLTISPIRNAAGEITGVSHIARDVSESKQLKDKLLLSQKMEALGHLAGGVAHDFNNLLTVIAGYGSLLQHSLRGDAQRTEMLDELMGAAARAAELTKELLAFSRRQVAHLQPLDLNETIRKTQGMLTRLIGEDISINTQLSGEISRVLADPGQLGQVIMNLAVNARDAMPQGGTIAIQTEPWLVESPAQKELGFDSGPYVRLLFTDTGEGMDAETCAHIFEPFFTTKQVGKGTGLGLATVYGIVKQSGGHISVYSQPGRGTTFAIYLRCAEGPGAGAPSCEPEAGQGSETILLVEDEPSLRRLAQSVLLANGYTVLAAANAEDALEQSRNHRECIHIVLTDIVMPGINGRVLAKQILQERPDVRVVFMSGYSENAILQSILSEKEPRFLQKPFTPAQLLKKVREVADSQQN